MPKNSAGASYFAAVTSWVRKWIVSLALWGWLPLRLAKWIIKHHEDGG